MKMRSLRALGICLVVAAICNQAKASNASYQTGTFGPKLGTVMTFLQDTLNSVGLVSYVSHGHDSKTGDDWTNRFTDQATRVVASTTACRISYHWKTTQDGIAAMDKDVGFELRDVQKIDVLTRLQYFNEENASTGHSSWSAQVEPPVFVVRIQRPSKENQFVFLDESLANRVAKMLRIAVNLCGGVAATGSAPAR